MKAIVISINPEWVAKILNGEKRVELRKNAPVNCEYPIDVYIYVTKDKKDKLFRNLSNNHFFLLNTEVDGFNGTVIAKFKLYNCIGTSESWDALEKFACVSEQEFKNYSKDKPVYMWTIDDLEIFDKPKELKQFLVYSHSVSGIGMNGERKIFDIMKPLTKAPQSWCYVEI